MECKKNCDSRMMGTLFMIRKVETINIILNDGTSVRYWFRESGYCGSGHLSIDRMLKNLSDPESTF
jgi:hypothetical protein